MSIHEKKVLTKRLNWLKFMAGISINFRKIDEILINEARVEISNDVLLRAFGVGSRQQLNGIKHRCARGGGVTTETARKIRCGLSDLVKRNVRLEEIAWPKPAKHTAPYESRENHTAR